MDIRLRKFYLIRETIRDLANYRFDVYPGHEVYLQAGIDWICAAQDSSADNGVARAYSLLQGWQPSYPETTGYIIPTLFDYYHYSSMEHVRERALRMADWLIDIQLSCGGIAAGTIDSPGKSTVFNTGQVLFGWIRAYKETQNQIYRDAIIRAADWLIQIQDDDGVWRRGASDFTFYNVNTYNTRTAWALLLASEICDKSSYKHACLKNVRWSISQQNAAGWFDNNCLDKVEAPYTHTIAYALQGILEIGLRLKDDQIIDVSMKTADALLHCQNEDGGLEGRYDATWKPTVKWSCLTGIAQISLVWRRLYDLTRYGKYLNAHQRSMHLLKSFINVNTCHRGIRGGLKGSYPIWAPYGKYQYLNWATKFLLDNLLAEYRGCSNKRDAQKPLVLSNFEYVN